MHMALDSSRAVTHPVGQPLTMGYGARSIQRKYPVLCGARLTHPNATIVFETGSCFRPNPKHYQFISDLAGFDPPDHD